MIEFLAIFALLLVAILALLAVLSDVVRDNLVERIGLACVCLAAVGRAADLHMNPPTPPASMLLFVAIAVYAMGSAWEKLKLWRARRDAQRKSIPEPFRTAAGFTTREDRQ